MNGRRLFCLMGGLACLGSSVFGAESLLNIETLREAKEVEVRIFNQKTGNPACRLSYATLEQSRPRIGPLTVNLQVLRLNRLRMEIDLDESTSSELFPELHRFAASRPFHFIDARPAEIVGKRDGKAIIHIQAGTAKFHRKGGFSLQDGVTWKVLDTEGTVPTAQLVFVPDKQSWNLLSAEQTLLVEFCL